MIKKILKFAFLFTAVSVVLSACAGAVPTNLPEGVNENSNLETLQAVATQISWTPTAGPSENAVAPTAVPPTAVPPTAVPPTSIPTTAIQATATSLPTPAFRLPAASRISFAPGATFTTVRGTIGAGQNQNFVIGALQAQPMQVSVSSQNNDVTMAIIAASGTTLLPASQSWSNWQGSLPATQDYYIQVIGGAGTEDFSMAISIPSRIQFEPGAISATVTGQTVNGNITSYVVAAQGGQTMNIVLNPVPNAAALTVWGFSDGQPYMRAQMGSTTFNMQLPSTQDYIIDVVPQAGQEVNFTLTVEIK